MARAARALGIGLVVTLGPAAGWAAAADRAMTQRFATNAPGDVVIVGNTVLDCPTAASGCPEARQGIETSPNPSTSSLWNDSYTMEWLDVDADPATFNSSRATLDLPDGAVVRFAGLYWGAGLSGGSTAPPSPSDNGKVLFDTPQTLGYQSVTASDTDASSSTYHDRYGAAADVTALVAAAGDGEYGVANVQAAAGGSDIHGGWALLVVYEHDGAPPRNLTVFDGFVTIEGTPHTFAVSGFQTPSAGPVRTALGFVGWEGESGASGNGDELRLDGTAIGDALNPTDNFVNGTVTHRGSRVAGRTPDYVNSFGGIDGDVVEVDGVLANGAIAASVELTTSGDWYQASAVAFVTDLHTPELGLSKAVTDTNGGSVQRGDVVEYVLAVGNSGHDQADATVITDPLPSGVEYVAGSIRLGEATLTDAGGDDAAEYDAGQRRVVVRPGGLPPGAGATFRFRASVTAAAGETVTNVASSTYRAHTLGFDRRAQSNPAAFVVAGEAADPTPSAPPVPLLLACDDASIALVDVVRKRRRVRITGVARSALAGERVALMLVDRKRRGRAAKTVGTAVVAADGSFKKKLRRPPRRYREPAYYARSAGGARSRTLELYRRMGFKRVRVRGGNVVLKGAVTKPRPPRGTRVRLKVRTDCDGRPVVVGRGRLNRRGRFRIAVAVPQGIGEALYRAQTKVPARKGSKRLRKTYTLPAPVAFG